MKYKHVRVTARNPGSSTAEKFCNQFCQYFSDTESQMTGCTTRVLLRRSEIEEEKEKEEERENENENKKEKEKKEKEEKRMKKRKERRKRRSKRRKRGGLML